MKNKELIKIEVTKACGPVGGAFEGRVKVESLPVDLLESLKIDLNSYESDYVNVTGDVTAGVNGDDDAYIDDLELTMWGAKTGKKIKVQRGYTKYIEEGRQYLKANYVDEDERYSVDIEPDNRFDFDSLLEELSTEIDAREVYMERAIRYADFMD